MSIIVFIESTMRQPEKTAATIGKIERGMAAKGIRANVQVNVISSENLADDAHPSTRIERLRSALEARLASQPDLRICICAGGAVMGGTRPDTSRFVLQATLLAIGGKSISTRCYLVFDRPENPPERLEALMDRQEERISQYSPIPKAIERSEDVGLAKTLKSIICDAMREKVDMTRH